jgi:hypothetical protein
LEKDMSTSLAASNEARFPQVEAERSPEMGRFNQGLREALSVSKEDLKRLLTDEKTRDADKPKRGPKPKHLIET